MHELSTDEALAAIRAKDARFHRDAYLFVREALDHTQKLVNKPEREVTRHGELGEPEKHVTGQQLLEGIRECALAQFGPMTVTVFEEWGIRHCRDFGQIVFNMVEHRLLKKTENDTPQDFETGYDFHDAFRKPFLPKSKLPSDPQKALK